MHTALAVPGCSCKQVAYGHTPYISRFLRHRLPTRPKELTYATQDPSVYHPTNTIRNPIMITIIVRVFSAGVSLFNIFSVSRLMLMSNPITWSVADTTDNPNAIINVVVRIVSESIILVLLRAHLTHQVGLSGKKKLVGYFRVNLFICEVFKLTNIGRYRCVYELLCLTNWCDEWTSSCWF